MIRMLQVAKPSALRGTALVWIDLNTADNARVVAALPTMRTLRAHAEKIVLISHRGRPDPKRPDPKLNLRRDARMLSRLFKARVTFVPGTDMKIIGKIVQYAPPGSVLLLENIRFFKGEAEHSKQFAKELARLGDYFVNEAFSVSHHASASMSVLPRLVPSFAGYDLEHEIETLTRVMQRPKRPLVLIVGGAKAEDKLGVLKAYAGRAQVILVGGASANTLLSLRGEDIGSSVHERDPKLLKEFKRILAYPNILLPLDTVRKGGKILDIGPETARQFATVIESARTVIWAGPLGMIEKAAYRKGTLAVARAIARNRGTLSITGGGETNAFLKKYGLTKKFDLVSTGGGAMLDFLAGKKLPGIRALHR